ncbi:MAG: multiheme c-type cytochrome, partial [Candidatus Aminicenantaceae bacterium]
MKKLVYLMGILMIIVPFMLFTQEFTYVGAAKCKMCHKSEKQGQQFILWEARKHSKSFSALTSEDAKALAADAPDNPECLKCHAPLAQKAPELKEEGVTCE